MFDLLTRQHGHDNGTAPAESFGLKPLRLKTAPERRIFPEVPRRMDLVDEKLAAGKAKWPLYLHSPVGPGKTFAALCLCDFAHTAIYHTVDNLCNRILRNVPLETDAEWSRIGSKALAVLDEIGERERVTDLHYTVLKQFLDTRELLAGRVGIYISNLKPDDLPKLYDDRLVSRLLAGTVFELTGPDRRRQG